jgi:RimJ/RimL family protein N-acetyltransferase
MMRVCSHPDASAFLARAEPWLERAAMEQAMALQTARFARADSSRIGKPQFWATIEDDDAIVGCAFRTPPYRLGITALPPAAVPLLVATLAEVYATLAGVAGPEPSASAFAVAWTKLRRGSARVQARQRLLAHRLIVPTGEPPPGALKLARAADEAVARQWGAAFAAESGLAALDGALCARLIGESRLYFWDDGHLECMLGVLRETRDAAAIGILYTPPARRERGYASAAVAAFSRQLLERGKAHSYFYIDPASIVADAICRKLGYAALQDTVDIDFSGA